MPLQVLKDSSQYLHREDTGFSQNRFMIDTETKREECAEDDED